ncbi:MAG: hypothetical protein IJG68_03795 [Bacilli bacterium]|nr:hypothetical protein [Bacilli bacterium]
MFTIYQKCEKSIDNLYGIKEIKEPENLDEAFLLCLTAQETNKKSVFGVIREGAQAARVRTSQELAGGFKIEEMPIAFLGAYYDKKDDSKTDLLDDFIYPYLKKGNNLEGMMKRARMMNFFTYCDATKVYVNLEERLKDKLKEDGLTDQDVKNILSQIGVISIASKVDISNLYANTVLFKDCNDREVYDYISKKALKQMERISRETIIGNLNSEGNVHTYVYNGSGEHELKEYLKDVNIVKSSLCAAVATLLENSIMNKNSEELIPLTGKQMLQTIIRYNGEFRGTDEYLEKLDQELSYGGVPRYTEKEHEILCDLEASYKDLANRKSNELNDMFNHPEELQEYEIVK